MKKKRIWPILALLITVLLMISAFGMSSVTVELFWKIGSDPAAAALQGEHLGAMICAVLLTAAPFIPVVCFLLERIGIRRARWKLEQEQPPEFATQEEREEFYLNELKQEQRLSNGTPWIVYAALCTVAVLVFAGGVLRSGLLNDIAETGSDLQAYRDGKPTIYEGPLLLTDRQLRDGIRRLPDERFVYYDASDDSFRCAASLLSETNLMQPYYTVEYLPQTGTILTITDAEGNVRTAGTDVAIYRPQGCWMYGDLAVPISSDVQGYDNLTAEQKALFDLMYSEVLSKGVAAGEIPTRRFDLPYPLKKEEFQTVLELYEASVNSKQRPTHGYRTDDGRMVRQAYCYGIIYTN